MSDVDQIFLFKDWVCSYAKAYDQIYNTGWWNELTYDSVSQLNIEKDWIPFNKPMNSSIGALGQESDKDSTSFLSTKEAGEDKDKAPKLFSIKFLNQAISLL